MWRDVLQVGTWKKKTGGHYRCFSFSKWAFSAYMVRSSVVYIKVKGTSSKYHCPLIWKLAFIKGRRL